MSCPHCGYDNLPDNRFCGRCGSPLDVSPISRPSGRTAYTPRHLAEKILTSRSALEGEHKQVTVVFCDIANSTVLAQQLGAERMHQVLDAFFEQALEHVHRFEGTINQFLGDGFMALFGAPLAHEDHAERAVSAALAIRDMVAAGLADSNLAPGRLAVRLGLNTGLVVVGKIGDNLRMDYTAVGDTTNVAARMQSLAEPGQILITEAVLRATRGAAEYRSLGPKRVKGKDHPLNVHEVMRARTAEEMRSARTGQPAAPLLGRERELVAFNRQLLTLKQGHGGLIWVLGEAGLGKSRLVGEARRQIDANEVLWLEGASPSFGRSLSYWPFLEMLKAYFDLNEQDVGAAAFARVEQHLRNLLPADEVSDVLPYLATLLALPLPEPYVERTRYLDGQGMGSQVFRAMRSFAQHVCAQRPLVLMFEDWHWADASSVELCEHLLPLASDHPVLFCFCARPDDSEPLRRIRTAARAALEGRTVELTLEPLDVPQAGVLANRLVGSQPLSATARESLVRIAGGNPFFLEELVGASIESGALTWDDGAGEWIASPDLAHLRVPDTLQGVIMARVDRLDEGVRQVLRTASVIGRTFFYRVLKAVIATESEREVRALQDLDLIREKQRLPELEYLFKHALVQEATYESMLAERRRELHRRVGAAIEQVFPARAAEFYPVLAYHFARAEDWEKAQEYLSKAGDRAAEVAADDEAVEHYRLAIAAHERAFGDRWTPLERARLHRKMGEALFRLGNHTRALTFLTEALSLLGWPYPASQTGVRMGLARELVKRMAGAVIPRRGGGRNVSSERSDAANEACQVIIAMGWIHVFTDSERLGFDTLVLVSLAEESGNDVQISIALGYLGLLFNVLGMHRLADRYHPRAIALARKNGNPIAMGHTYFTNGMGHYYTGRWDPALDSFERGATAFRSIGHFHLWGGPRAWYAFTLQAMGQARALEVSEEIVRAARETRDRELEAWGLLSGGLTLRQDGQYDVALRQFGVAARLFEAIPDQNDLALANAESALCHAHKGEFARALELADMAKASCDARAPKGIWAVLPYSAIAEAYVIAAEGMQGDGRRGEKVLREAQRLARNAWKHGKVVSSQWTPESLRLLGICDWLGGNRARAQRRWAQAAKMAQKLGAMHTLAQIEQEIGRRTGSQENVDRAVELFKRGGFLRRAASEVR